MKTTDDYIATFATDGTSVAAMRAQMLGAGLFTSDVEHVIKQVQKARCVNRLMLEKAKACGRAL